MNGPWSPALRAALLCVSAIGVLTAARGEDVDRPNLMIVLVDDMGYSDIGCYGGEIETPNLDSLAAEGVRFRWFLNGAQCVPTRGSLLSGLYPHESGLGDMNARGPEDPFWRTVGAESYLGFRTEGMPTIAESLSAAGYRTFMSGKWHVGDTEPNWPSSRGFDRCFSLIFGASNHFTGGPSFREGPLSLFVNDGEKVEVLPDNFYSTDTFTDRALQFLGEHDGPEPWFLYLAYTAPHWPIQAHEADIGKFRGRYDCGFEAVREARFERQKAMGLFDGSAVLPEFDREISGQSLARDDSERNREVMEVYAAMIHCVDRNVGRVVNLLRERGELENTLIVFLSDNGADNFRFFRWGETSNAPFRLYKTYAHNGGIATPCIVHWPEGIPKERRGTLLFHAAGHVMDLYPTLLAAAGAQQLSQHQGKPSHPLSGRNLLPLITGEEPDRWLERPLHFERMGNSAMLQGEWKLVRVYNSTRDENGHTGPRSGEWELYHLETDPTETRNLAEEEPERLQRMISVYKTWENEVGVVPREELVRKLREFQAGHSTGEGK